MNIKLETNKNKSKDDSYTAVRRKEEGFQEGRLLKIREGWSRFYSPLRN